MLNKLSGILMVIVLALGATKAGATLTDDPCDDGVGPACNNPVLVIGGNDSEAVVLAATGMTVMEITKFDEDNTAGWPDPDTYLQDGITVVVDSDKKMGTWSSPGKAIDYVVIKTSSEFALYDYVGSNALGDVWDTNKIENKEISHISFYMKVPVPEPSTFLLVGFGIGVAGLAGYRERKKKS